MTNGVSESLNVLWYLQERTLLQNVGVLKSMMGEITDSTNITEAYGFLPVRLVFGAYSVKD
jgi:hypothetical protein